MPGSRLLHAPDIYDASHGWGVQADGAAACGRVGSMAIPGIFSRMALRRCPTCCKALGYPPGKGSPKNDVALRPLVEERLRAFHDVPSL